MAGTRSLRLKFKNFFGSKEGSDVALEILQKFVLPFTKALPQWAMSIDDVLKAFFALDDREFFYVRAKRKFRLPGGYLEAGNVSNRTINTKPEIQKGQVLLLVLDRKEANARVAFFLDGKEMNYRMFRHEVETIKDWVEVISDKGDGDRHRNDGALSLARRPDRSGALRRKDIRKRSRKTSVP